MPVISKGSSGACGFDVRKFDTRHEVMDFVEAVFSAEGVRTSFAAVRQKNYVYLQEFIPARGDLRIVTVGDQVALAYWRVNEKGWKFNINSGGRIEKEAVPSAASEVALKVARCLGMHWCACDLLMKDDTPLLTECSATFGIVPPDRCIPLFGSPHAQIPPKQACYVLRALEARGFSVPRRTATLDSIGLL